MNVLGIETSCDECSASIVADGKTILSNVITTQIEVHRPYNGVVPELASRTHTEWIAPIVERAISEADIKLSAVDAIAVTNRPGLIGSLLVGLSFGKSLAYALRVPLVAINHIEAHIYAPHLEHEIGYPYLGVIVSGGHTIIAEVNAWHEMRVIGTTIDDACGEAFDKVAKHFDFGFPGGKSVDDLARRGNPEALLFPDASLHKGDHRYDVSYSGLKTAAINQLDRFLQPGCEATPENIAASFERAAVDMLMKRIERGVDDLGMKRVVVGGGVAANTYFRERLALLGSEVYLPSLALCTDNGAMIAGLGFHHVCDGRIDDLEVNAVSRVPNFRKTYP